MAGARPGPPGSLPLPLPCLEGESSPGKSTNGPGLWHAVHPCLVLALGWWLEELAKAVEMSGASAVSVCCPLLISLFYIFICA